MTTMTKIEMRTVKITLVGLPPGLLFQSKGVMAAPAVKKPRPPEEEARLRAHWIGIGKKAQLGLPTVMIYRSLCQAALDFKQKKGKKSMAYIIGSTVSFEEKITPMLNSRKKPATHEVYLDYVRIPPRTGAMVQIGRPLIRDWQVTLNMTVDDEGWEIPQAEDILAFAGKSVGVGAWRPGLKGPYGKFVVKEFKIVA